MTFEYTHSVTLHWSTAAQVSFENIKQAILSNPCLQRFNDQHLIVLWSDFSSKSYGYMVCQPGTDKASTKAASAYCPGANFSFMTKTSKDVLHPVVFGARRCRGKDVRLHSHLEKGFVSDWAMNKCRHMLFGQRIVWVTNCYAMKYFFLYKGANHTVLCLQMDLMCWNVDIIHQNNHYITDADYWLQIGTELCFDPPFKAYLDLVHTLCLKNPPPTSFPMKPEHML
jgi:hypothetical protein